MQASELKNAISIQAKEFRSTGLIPREQSRHFHIEPGFAMVVSGVRRCGKSTFLRQWSHSISRSIMLNFDDLRMLQFTPDDFRVLDAALADLQPETLIFDELQSIPGWELYIRQKLDGNFNCVVTGSNASMLSRELGTKLTGRHLNLALAPFSYTEYLLFTHSERGSESLRNYLTCGGFPAYLKTGSIEILKTLLDDILFRDVAVRYGIGDISLLRSLCLYLIGAAGNLVSPNKLLQVFHIRSATTMLEYFSYLEQSYLVQRVPKFSASRRAQQLAPKKIYAIDNALIAANRLTARPDNGFLLENAVYNYLRQQNLEINYFADENGECDFIVRDANGTYSAYQVCWEVGDTSRVREFSGLVHCMKAFGLKSGVIVTFDQKDFAIQDGMDIHLTPAWEFFQPM